MIWFETNEFKNISLKTKTTFLLQGPFLGYHPKIQLIFFSPAPIPGIQTSQDARFYAVSAHFEPFGNEGKPLVVQFTVKHEQKIDCGGGYVKIFPADLDQNNMHGDSQYYIMFGKSCLSWGGIENTTQNTTAPREGGLWRMCNAVSS